jgi:hypothetical protein
MPYKSDAQRRLMHHLASTGKLAPEVVKEYDRESKGKNLPEYVTRKAFGGEISAKKGVRCPACDYPLDQAPVALDAGEGCPRCGYGDAKSVPHKAQGGEVMESSAYRAHGGEMCSSCGAKMSKGGLAGDMKELYPRKKERGADLDDGKARFASAIMRRGK